MDAAIRHTASAALRRQLDPVAAVVDVFRTGAESITSSLTVPTVRDPVQAAARIVDPITTGLDDLLAARVARLTGDRSRLLLVTPVGLVLALRCGIAVWWQTRHVRTASTSARPSSNCTAGPSP